MRVLKHSGFCKCIFQLYSLTNNLDNLPQERKTLKKHLRNILRFDLYWCVQHDCHPKRLTFLVIPMFLTCIEHRYHINCKNEMKRRETGNQDDATRVVQ